MAVEGEFFKIRGSTQGFANPSMAERRRELGKKGAEARKRRMAEKRAAGETKVWSGGFKSGDPYTRQMAKFAINERWRKYYEQKAKQVEDKLEYDPEKYERSIVESQKKLDEEIVPLKNEAKSLVRNLESTQREVRRVGGMVERIQQRVEEIRAAAAASPPRRFVVPPSRRPGIILAPKEAPVAEQREPEASQLGFGFRIVSEEKESEEAPEFPIRPAPEPEPSPAAEVVAAQDLTNELFGFPVKLTGEPEPPPPEPSSPAPAPKKSRAPRKKKEAVSAPEPEVSAAAPVTLEAVVGPPPAEAIEKESTGLFGGKPRGLKGSKNLSEMTSAVTVEHVAAAAMLAAFLGGSVSTIERLARKIASRSEEYRMGLRDPMHLDPDIAASPSVQRILVKARKRLGM